MGSNLDIPGLSPLVFALESVKAWLTGIISLAILSSIFSAIFRCSMIDPMCWIIARHADALRVSCDCKIDVRSRGMRTETPFLNEIFRI